MFRTTSVPTGWRGGRRAYTRNWGYHVPRDAFHSAENPLGLQFAAVAPHGPLTRKLSYSMASAGGQVLAALLLFATQVYVFLRLKQDFDGPAVWCFALVPLATLLVGCAMYIVTLNAFRRGEKPWYGTPTKPPLTIHTAIGSARRAIARAVRAMRGRLSRFGR